MEILTIFSVFLLVSDFCFCFCLEIYDDFHSNEPFMQNNDNYIARSTEGIHFNYIVKIYEFILTKNFELLMFSLFDPL